MLKASGLRGNVLLYYTSFRGFMSLDKVGALVALSELGDTVTLEQLCLPLVNADTSIGVSRSEMKRMWYHDAVSVVMAFKLKFLVQHGKNLIFPLR